VKLPPTIHLPWRQHFRVIPTRHPYIDVFDNKGLTEVEKEAIWALQERTNPRLNGSALARVRPGDLAAGDYSYYLNGPFIHIGNASRFTNGDFGVYYAAHDLKTAIIETKYGYERLYRASKLESQMSVFRALKGNKVNQSLYDIRKSSYYKRFLNPDIATYPRSQAFAQELRQEDPDSWGIVYPSVRDPDGECIAVFRPSALPIPVPACLLIYEWDGKKIKSVSESKTMYEF